MQSRNDSDISIALGTVRLLHFRNRRRAEGVKGGKSPPFFMCGGCAQRRQAIHAGVKALAHADLNAAKAEASTFIRSAVSDLSQLRKSALVQAHQRLKR